MKGFQRKMPTYDIICSLYGIKKKTVRYSTFMNVLVFLFCNMAGVKTSYETKLLIRAISVYSVPLLLMLGLLQSHKVI